MGDIKHVPEKEGFVHKDTSVDFEKYVFNLWNVIRKVLIRKKR